MTKHPPEAPPGRAPDPPRPEREPGDEPPPTPPTEPEPAPVEEPPRPGRRGPYIVSADEARAGHTPCIASHGRRERSGGPCEAGDLATR